MIDFLTRWLPNANYPPQVLNEWLDEIQNGFCPNFDIEIERRLLDMQTLENYRSRELDEM